VQKIKGAWDIKLRQKGIVPLVGVLDNSNNQTLEDLKRLQKIFSKNSFAQLDHVA
jgi:predicted RecB family endonuclease